MSDVLKTYDRIEKFHGALIQHGESNRRIYVMKLGAARGAELVGALADLARANGYTKVFAKVPLSKAEGFLESGYEIEARIPGFYGGQEEAVFLGCFLDESRREVGNADHLEEVLRLARAKRGERCGGELPAGMRIRECGPEDAEVMSAIYGEVFASYPFAIDRPEYLRETMRTHVRYFGVEYEGKLIALASSEMDRESQTVEMTDFATPERWRGRGLAVRLLGRMEEAMAAEGMGVFYTIARAVSVGMNITFAKRGYEFGGRLVNNTQISGRIESMNIWWWQRHTRYAAGGE